jgi:ABC-type branched-subunit amino acid transport system substrate-binding protein
MTSGTSPAHPLSQLKQLAGVGREFEQLEAYEKTRDEYAKKLEEYEKKFGELPPKPFIDSAYDATYLLALAAEKAGSNDPQAIRDALRSVANPPGTKVGPGEFGKARNLLAKGEEIDYEGASGSQDFDAVGDVPGTFAHWEIQDGKIVTVKVFEPK